MLVGTTLMIQNSRFQLGTTSGPDVNLDKNISPYWEKLVMLTT